MDNLTREDLDSLRSGIDDYRAAWLAYVDLPDEAAAGEYGPDTVMSWRGYGAQKRIDRTKETLILILSRMRDRVPAVSYQGIVYSLTQADGQRPNPTYRGIDLVEREDRTLVLDWPDDRPRPALPYGPATWGE